MAVFQFEAMDRRGKSITGDVEADDETAAAHEIRSQGLHVTMISMPDGLIAPDTSSTLKQESFEREPTQVMTESFISDDTTTLLELSAALLKSVDTQDWNAYQEICHDSLTAFEPEARGQLVEGLEFHHFYFELNSSAKRSSSICSPQVRIMGDSATVTYSRLVQVYDGAGTWTSVFEETRIWQRIDGNWRHIHFHRSEPSA